MLRGIKRNKHGSTDKIALELINEKVKVSVNESDMTRLTEGKAKTSNHQVLTWSIVEYCSYIKKKLNGWESQ